MTYKSNDFILKTLEHNTKKLIPNTDIHISKFTSKYEILLSWDNEGDTLYCSFYFSFIDIIDIRAIKAKMELIKCMYDDIKYNSKNDFSFFKYQLNLKHSFLTQYPTRSSNNIYDEIINNTIANIKTNNQFLIYKEIMSIVIISQYQNFHKNKEKIYV